MSTKTQKNWKTLEIVEDPPGRLSAEDRRACHYARDYFAQGGYQAGDGNRLILNFKKPNERRKNEHEWKHRVNAIRQFANELAPALPKEFAVCFVPPSIAKGDTGYSDRFDVLADRLRNLGCNVFDGFTRKASTPSLHSGEGDRDSDSIASSLTWNPPDEFIKIAIVDDIITTGASYKACQQLVLEWSPTCEILGFFWARRTSTT